MITWIRKIRTAFYHKEPIDYKVLEFAQNLKQARREWANAQNYYNNALDEDLVDHAAYMLKAAEKKYAYLFKLAKQEGVRHHPFF